MNVERNSELTQLTAGRVITAALHAEGYLQLSMDDGSFMKIKTSGHAPAQDAMLSRTIEGVGEGDDEISIEFVDASSIVIRPEAGPASVLFVAADGTPAYSR